MEKNNWRYKRNMDNVVTETLIALENGKYELAKELAKEITKESDSIEQRLAAMLLYNLASTGDPEEIRGTLETAYRDI